MSNYRMPLGTASAKLRKSILFLFIKRISYRMYAINVVE